MNMINVIVNFRRYLKRRNYSPHTVKYYLNVLRQFVIWLNVPLEQVSAALDDLRRLGQVDLMLNHP